MPRTSNLPHKPLLTLIGGIVLVFLGQVALPIDWMAYAVRPVEVQQAWEQLRAGNFSSDALMALATLFTATLLHGGPEHILLNMVYLWLFAALVAQALGYRWMLFLFVVTGIAGNLTQCFLNWESAVPILGASGAVMGFEGAYLGLWMRFRLRDPDVWPISRPIPPGQLVLLAVFGAAMDISGLIGANPGIAYGAHLGGLVSGLFLSTLFVRRVNDQALA